MIKKIPVLYGNDCELLLNAYDFLNRCLKLESPIVNVSLIIF